MRSQRGFSLFLSLAFLTVSLLCSTSAFGQKVSGSVTGTVTDPQGAVVPGATVTLTDVSTNAVRRAESNSAGNYEFQEVDPGTYNIKVSKTGFNEYSTTKVEVHVSSVTRIDAKLRVGSIAETVTVEAQGIQVNTENGEVGNVIEGTQVRELPLNGRNFVQLTTLMPGASVAEGFDNKSKGLMGGVDISFSGAPSNANQWRVDGANNNDIGSQRTILMYPSIDGIEEFKILRNSYGPEYGGAGGAQINVVSKGGGNEFHGDLFYFGRNDFLNAKSYFIGLNQCTLPDDVRCKKQSLRRNDYGYTLGGPIVKDKIFFFWSEEWNVERRGAVRHDAVPTQLERNGDFSGGGGCGGVPNFPAGTTSAPGVLNPNYVSAGGQAYVSQVPLPTISNCTSGYNWISQVNVPLNWREESIKVDYKFTKNNNLMIKYAQDSWDNPLHASANGEAGLWGTQDFPAVSDAWTQPSKMAIARLTTTIGSGSVNDFQFSWSGSNIGITRAGDDKALGAQIRSQIPTVFPTSGKLHSSDLPLPICWCSTFFGIQSPWANRQDLFTWKDDFSRVTGKHTLKFGVLYARNAKDEEQGLEAGGLWGSGGFQKVDWSNTGNFYGDMLLKGMTWGGQENARNVLADIRWRDAEFYAGDNWKVSKRVTFDYGFRWSFINPEYMEKNDWSIFSLSAYNPAAKGDPCNGIMLPKGGDPNLCSSLGSSVTPVISQYRSLRPSNKHLIAPRLGVAWDVLGSARFVLRAGVGQFFARDPVGFTLRAKSVNPPYGVSTNIYTSFDGPLVPGTNVFDGGGGTNLAASGTPGQAFEQDTNLSNSWQWNVTTETMLAKNTKLELGWVALRGIHLTSASDLNQIRPEDRLAYIQAGIAGVSDRSGFFPLGAMTTNQITEWNHRGDSIYHSLQAMFSSKVGRNSQIQSSYTWSHNISTTTLGYVGTSTALSDSYNSRVNRGNADFDRRQVFNVSWVFNTPTLQGRNAFLKGVAGGWETSSILNIASGPAVSISGNVSNVCPSQAQLPNCNLPNTDPNYVAPIGIGNPWGVANAGQFGARPNVTSQPCSTGQSLTWINQTGFSYNGFPLGGYPNAGPGQCAGPGTRDVDFAVSKNWDLPVKGAHFFTEGAKLQFRIEMFNAFNHPMFRFNNTNLSYAATGTAGGAVTGYISPQNTIEGTVLTTGSNFGKPPFLNNLGNREIQYALKFIF
jgi:carboxypeptidase family protein